MRKEVQKENVNQQETSVCDLSVEQMMAFQVYSKESRPQVNLRSQECHHYRIFLSGTKVIRSHLSFEKS